MKREEFIIKLKSAYKTDQFTEQNVEDIEQWFIDECLSDEAIKDLYKNIKLHYKYKTFPGLSHVADIYKKNRKQIQKRCLNPTLEKYQHENIDVMIARLKDICTRDVDTINNDDIDFMYYYSDMLYVWNIISDSDMSDDERQIYMRKVKETIQSGGTVNVAAVERHRRSKAS